jgi:hypothetical protein
MRLCALLSRSGDCGCKRNYQDAEEALHILYYTAARSAVPIFLGPHEPLPCRTGANCVACASVRE